VLSNQAGDVLAVVEHEELELGVRQAKAALEAVAKVLAKEEQPYNIRVNIIALGLVETDMGSRLVKAQTGKDIQELYHDMPFGRICQPSDVGNLCAFLCSDQGGYISGHAIYVDGGSQEIIP